MKLEIETTYNIGDKVLVKKPHSIQLKEEPFEAVITGIIINKNARATRVYYTVENKAAYFACEAWGKKKKYNKNELELIEAKTNE